MRDTAFNTFEAHSRQPACLTACGMKAWHAANFWMRQLQPAAGRFSRCDDVRDLVLFHGFV